MATTTTKLGLTKPAGSDNVDIAVLNTNADKIDSAIGITICTSTSRPATPFEGQNIYETDTKLAFVYSSGAFKALGSTTVVSSTTRPATPVVNEIIFETDTHNFYIYTGSAWRPIGKTIIASSTARDALFPSPVQGDEVFRNDLGYTETYYALYNASTNTGGVTTAGWYPTTNPPVFYGTATGSFPSGPATLIGSTGFAYTELLDPLGWHSPSTNPTRITPTIAGYYRVTHGASFNTGTTGVRQAYVLKNGAIYGYGTTGNIIGAASNSMTVSASGIIAMNGTTDYLEQQIYQTQGAALTGFTQFNVEFVRPL